MKERTKKIRGKKREQKKNPEKYKQFLRISFFGFENLLGGTGSQKSLKGIW